MGSVKYQVMEELCVEAAKRCQGTSFVLLMDSEKGHNKGFDYTKNHHVGDNWGGHSAYDFSIHVRSNQPCYGEFRKYSKTHKDCTQKGTYKPTDLFDPFPSGIPVGVTLPFGQYNPYMTNVNINRLLTELFSNESPWKKGFHDEKYVLHYEKDGKNHGVHLRSTHIDSTVLVSLCWFVRQEMSGYGFYCRLREKGMTIKEAAFTSLLTNGTRCLSNGYHNDYNFAGPISLKMFFEGDPHDFTGGSFRDGFDYDRKNIQDLFKSPHGFKHKEIDFPKGIIQDKDFDLFIEKAKEAFKKHLDAEPPTEKILYKTPEKPQEFVLKSSNSDKVTLNITNPPKKLKGVKHA